MREIHPQRRGRVGLGLVAVTLSDQARTSPDRFLAVFGRGHGGPVLTMPPRVVRASRRHNDAPHIPPDADSRFQTYRKSEGNTPAGTESAPAPSSRRAHRAGDKSDQESVSPSFNW